MGLRYPYPLPTGAIPTLGDADLETTQHLLVLWTAQLPLAFGLLLSYGGVWTLDDYPKDPIRFILWADNINFNNDVKQLIGQLAVFVLICGRFKAKPKIQLDKMIAVRAVYI
ncbi:hypothetical protein Tco_1065594 [Tanacetum coccineum]